MYLVSRFERALREAISSGAVKQSRNCWLPTDSIPPKPTLDLMVQRSVASALKSRFVLDRKEIQTATYPPQLGLEFVLENAFVVVWSAMSSCGWERARSDVDPRHHLERLLMCDLIL